MERRHIGFTTDPVLVSVYYERAIFFAELAIPTQLGLYDRLRAEYAN